MVNKANPAAIGAFVVGAVVLAVAGTLAFGSGKLFKRTTKVVCFFTGDLSGLNVGAPVRFKGVEVGSVADIRIRMGEEAAKLTAETIAQGIRIPVIMEIDNDKLTAEGALPLLDRAQLKRLIDLGLRAQLSSQSLVTGLLLVRLDFYPDTPPVFVLPPDSSLAEIPSVPTSMQQVQAAAQDVIRKLEDIDFKKLVASATEAIDGVKSLAQSPGLQKALNDLPETVTNANQAVTSLRDLATRFDREQGPLLQSLRETSDKTAATLQEARQTFQRAQALIDPNAPLAVDLATSLREIAAAARSVRLLADYLERNPSALVRGREAQAK
jgi:paraquat-inducible protein B